MKDHLGGLIFGERLFMGRGFTIDGFFVSVENLCNYHPYFHVGIFSKSAANNFINLSLHI